MVDIAIKIVAIGIIIVAAVIVSLVSWTLFWTVWGLIEAAVRRCKRKAADKRWQEND
jgi:hypothetical protein